MTPPPSAEHEEAPGPPRARLRDRVRSTPLDLPASYAWGLLTGQWPRPVATSVERWRTRSPRTFGEKVRYKMCRDRRPILAVFADKLATRAYVSERVGEQALPRLLAVATDPTALPWDRLPREFVVKVNHGSGGVVVVAESADPDRRLIARTRWDSWGRQWIHPDAFDPDDACRLIDRWLGMRYRQGPLLRYEWAYRRVEPRVLVEEYCGDGTRLPADLKIMCTHGEPRLYSVLGRNRDFRLTERTRFLAAEADSARVAAQVDERTWSWIVSSTRELSSDTDLVRVDWLLTPRGPLVGELTNYPSSGAPTFDGHARLTSDQVDAVLSSQWSPPTRYQ